MKNGSQDFSLLNCMKLAWSQKEGNLQDHRRRIVQFVSLPIVAIPIIHLLKFSPLEGGEARAVLAAAMLLGSSADLFHTTFLLKVTPGITNRDYLETGYRSFAYLGYSTGLVLLSVILMIWGA